MGEVVVPETWPTALVATLVAVLVALVGWLAGLDAARRGAERGARLALENALRLDEERRDAHKRDLRSALLAEMRLNADTLERARHGEGFGHIRSAAWDANVGQHFTERESKALLDSQAKLSAYEAALTFAESKWVPGEDPQETTMGRRVIDRAEEAGRFLAFALAVLEGRG
jgi:hypothetical protein